MNFICFYNDTLEYFCSTNNLCKHSMYIERLLDKTSLT
jgi:hypothetical protein